MNQLDLSLEELEEIEAPITTAEGVGICLIALGSGVLVGILVAT